MSSYLIYQQKYARSEKGKAARRRYVEKIKAIVKKAREQKSESGRGK